MNIAEAIMTKFTAEEAKIVETYHADKAKAELWVKSNKAAVVAVAAALIIGGLVARFVL